MSATTGLAALRAAEEHAWEHATRHHHHSADLLVAGLRVRIEVAGARLLAALLPPLEVHPGTNGRPPQVRIRAYDATETRTVAPQDQGGLAQRIAGWSAASDDDAGLRWSWNDAAGLLLLTDPAGLGQVAAVTSADSLPEWELAAPLRQLFAWGMASAGRTVVHGAAVGDHDGVVLLAGAGGSGKSSTALSCFLAGMGYIGDDYVALTLEGGRPMAHALFGTAKVLPHELLLADPSGWLLPHLLRQGGGGDERVVVLPGRGAPERMLPGAPIRAVVVPAAAPPAGLTTISAAEALRCVAPSSLFQLADAGADELRALSQLVRSLPCYRLGLRPDRGANPPVIASLLEAA